MGYLRKTAILITTIMIFSSLSGLIYDEIKKSDEFQNEYIKHLSEEQIGNEVIDAATALYDDFDCLFEDEELCFQTFQYGIAHNQKLNNLLAGANDLGVGFGEGATEDLLVYDRVVMNTADPEIMESYHNSREHLALALELANTSENDTSYQKTLKFMNGTLDNPELYCVVGNNDTEIIDICEGLMGEVYPVIRMATSTIFLENDDSFMEKLLEPNNLSEESDSILKLIATLAHATRAYWSCDENATPSLLDSTLEAADSFCSLGDVESSTGDESIARDHHESSFWQSLSVKEKLLFVLDCVMIAAALVLAVAIIMGSGGATGWAVVAAFLELFGAGYEIVHALHSMFHHDHINTAIDNLDEICTDGIDNDGDGLIDCDDEECASHASCIDDSDPPTPPAPVEIGSISITGANYVRISDYSPTGAYLDVCNYDYEMDFLGVTAPQSELNYHWTVVPNFGKDGHPYSVWGQMTHPNIKVGFNKQGPFTIRLTVTHDTAIDSPQYAEKEVNAGEYYCSDTVPMESDYKEVSPHISEWSGMISVAPALEGETWYSQAVSDLGNTMKSSTWLSEQECSLEDWNCYAASVGGIHHNNFLGMMYDSHSDLGLTSRLTDVGFLNNLDATVVNSNHPYMIESYIDVRPLVYDYHLEVRLLSQNESLQDQSLAYIQSLAILNLAEEMEISAEQSQVLRQIVENWDEDSVDDDYLAALESIISSEGFEKLSEHTQYSYHLQLSVMRASGPECCQPQSTIPPQSMDTSGRKPNWRAIADGAMAVLAVGSAIMGNIPAAALSGAMAAGSLAHHSSGDAGGLSTGFVSENYSYCPTVGLQDCVSSRLQEVNYFEGLRAGVQANVCGEDPDLITISSIPAKLIYNTGDIAEFSGEANCAILGLNYAMKISVIQQSSNSVVFDNKFYWLETDNSESFSGTVDQLDADTYCVNVELKESLNPVIVATASTCFDILAKSSTSDPKDDESVPGFSIMSGILALLGAAIILHRRVESE